ncbi:MAG TPA: hypothetical protein VN785_10100 [Candidatus Angelobacter sp.]|nr:hypothetical protein [Candidatus Angelobacter sp.]
MKSITKWKIGAAIVFLSLAILLPEVVSAGWHIVHGRSVVFRSWKITVPFGWYAVRHGEGISVIRMSRLSWQDNPEVTFLPVHFSKTYQFDYDAFAGVQSKLLRAKGYTLSGQEDIRIGDQGGRCWTFTSTNRHGQQWINCVAPKDLTSADYKGPLAYANKFLSVMANIQHETPAR